jgi:hypothetical protein
MLPRLDFPTTEPCVIQMQMTHTARVASSALISGELSSELSNTEFWRVTVEIAATGDVARSIEVWGRKAIAQHRLIGLWPLTTPQPRGTIGTSALSAWSDHPPGSMYIRAIAWDADAGKTILMGDTIGVKNRWYTVAADTTFQGVGAYQSMAIVRLAQPLSDRLMMGDPITLDKPMATFAIDDDVFAPTFTPAGADLIMRVAFSATEQ